MTHPVPSAPHTARPVDAQDRFAVAAHLVLHDSPGRPGPPTVQRWMGPGDTLLPPTPRRRLPRMQECVKAPSLE